MPWRTALAGTVLAVWTSAASAQTDAAYGRCGDPSDRLRQIEACTQMIRDPSLSNYRRAGAYLYRCQAKDVSGKPAAALADCRKAIELEDGDAASYNSLSIVHQGLKQWEEAIAASDEAIAIGGADIANFYNTRANARCGAKQVYGSVVDRLLAIRYGAVDAKNAQRLLKRDGFYTGVIDGKFGPASEAALKAWTENRCG